MALGLDTTVAVLLMLGAGMALAALFLSSTVWAAASAAAIALSIFSIVGETWIDQQLAELHDHLWQTGLAHRTASPRPDPP